MRRGRPPLLPHSQRAVLGAGTAAGPRQSPVILWQIAVTHHHELHGDKQRGGGDPRPGSRGATGSEKRRCVVGPQGSCGGRPTLTPTWPLCGTRHDSTAHAGPSAPANTPHRAAGPFQVPLSQPLPPHPFPDAGLIPPPPASGGCVPLSPVGLPLPPFPLPLTFPAWSTHHASSLGAPRPFNSLHYPTHPPAVLEARGWVFPAGLSPAWVWDLVSLRRELRVCPHRVSGRPLQTGRIS